MTVNTAQGPVDSISLGWTADGKSSVGSDRINKRPNEQRPGTSDYKSFLFVKLNEQGSLRNDGPCHAPYLTCQSPTNSFLNCLPTYLPRRVSGDGSRSSVLILTYPSFPTGVQNPESPGKGRGSGTGRRSESNVYSGQVGSPVSVGRSGSSVQGGKDVSSVQFDVSTGFLSRSV